MKKTVSILIAAVILFCGCGSEPKRVSVAVPSDGWTAGTLMETAVVCGNRLSCPLTLDNFQKNIELREDKSVEGNNSVSAGLYRKGSKDEYLGFATFKDVDKFSDINGGTVISGIFFQNNFKTGADQISLNGVVMGDSQERVEELLGPPDKTLGNGTLIYNAKDKTSFEIHIQIVLDQVFRIYIYGLN